MAKKLFLVFMSVLSQSFLTLVRSDLMSFSFFTARHNNIFLSLTILKSVQIIFYSCNDLGIIRHFFYYLKLFFRFVILLGFKVAYAKVKLPFYVAGMVGHKIFKPLNCHFVLSRLHGQHPHIEKRQFIFWI